MTAGFSQLVGHVFRPVWANDFNDYAVDTYRENFGHGIGSDIVDLLWNSETRIPDAEVVIGGPPCQGFSLLNKQRDGDPRRHLWRPFLEVVRRSEASVWVMENVPQLLHSPEYEDIAAEAAGDGFRVAGSILCAADYGVAQTRYRTFIVGCNFLDPSEFFPPLRTHRPPERSEHRRMFNGDHTEHLEGAETWRTVRDVICDLGPPVGTEVRDVEGPYDLHFGRMPTQMSLERYASIPPGGNRTNLPSHLMPQCWINKSGGTDLFGRLWWDRPSVTIRTEFFKPEKGRYLHPQQDRPITHREAARIQSFPDEFRFKGTKIEIAKQIGNAVPPILAARIADVVLAILMRRD